MLSVWTPPEDDLPLERKKGGERTPLMSSGSWDRTARIWELCDHSSASSSSGSGTASSSSSTSFAAKEHAQPGGAVSCSWRVKETLKGHEQAVWGVAIVKPGVYLTG